MKYIDSEKLIAEIERLQKFNHNMADNAINSNMRNFYDGAEDCGKQLISFIATLQQEQSEVDLEKEIDAYMYPIQSIDVQQEPFTSLEKCARHFYELGLNTRKK